MINQEGLNYPTNGANPITAASDNPFANANSVDASTGCPMLINGSTARNALPTVAGFPLKDNARATDSRYLKVFNRGGTGNNDAARHFYWVSSEMVSKWYIQTNGMGNGGGGTSNSGDEDNWITAGYGDLSYQYNVMQ